MPKLPRSISSATSSMASGTIPSRPAKPHPDRLKIMQLFPDRPLVSPCPSLIPRDIDVVDDLLAVERVGSSVCRDGAEQLRLFLVRRHGVARRDAVGVDEERIHAAVRRVADVPVQLVAE